MRSEPRFVAMGGDALSVPGGLGEESTIRGMTEWLLYGSVLAQWPAFLYNNIPAIDADIKFAIVPASMARTPSRASSLRLFGARAPMPPI
jgi:hypothetical protein